MGPRALSMSGKYFTTESHAQSLKDTFYQKLKSHFSQNPKPRVCLVYVPYMYRH